MQYLIFAVIFSVSVSILLKLANKRAININQAIAINYLTAISWCYFLLTPSFEAIQLTPLVNQQTLSLLGVLLLGGLLPAVFIFMSKAVQYAGIVRADAAQRLSLLLQILAAVLFFGETLTAGRIIGIALAFMALFCLLAKPEIAPMPQKNKAGLFLILVWLGYALIGLLFKLIAKMGQSFPTALFLSFLFAGGFMLGYLALAKTRWHKAGILVGLVLGSLNFFNILFYIKAHQYFHQSPTLVFAGMDIGVISLATLIGAFYFKEKISKLNGSGILLGIGAIFCLFYLDNWL